VTDLGKILIGLGALILVIGVVVLLLGRLNVPVGRLPGDIVYRGKHTTFYFPIVTSILLSIILSLIFYFLGRMRH
jgi:Protein of unknown function (DUF2905)